MKSRTANLPSNGLFQSLSQAKLDLDELKQRQATSARSGVLSYFVQSTNAWDIQRTIGLSGDTTTRTSIVNVNYLGDGSQDVAFANVSYSVYVNGTDSAHQLTPTQSTWTDGTRTAAISGFGLTVSHFIYQAQFTLTTLKDVTLYVKGYAVASQRGNLSFSVV